MMREVTGTITAESWVVFVENDDSKLSFAKIVGDFTLTQFSMRHGWGWVVSVRE